MSEGVGKLQIVIKGGKPWGFRLKSYSGNRSSVVIDHIEPGGKAEINGGLKVGDHVIKINDVLCLSLADALQLIDSAFRTLTVLVWRPSYAQSNVIAHNNNVKLPKQNYSNRSLLSYVNKIPESHLQKFQDFQYNVAFSRGEEKCFSDSPSSKKEDSKPSLHLQISNFSKTYSKSLDVLPKNGAINNFSSKDSLNVSRSFKVKSSYNHSESFNSLPSQSHQSSNLQYICEQYPLSELFLNNKSDLKLESHSKRCLKTHPSQGVNGKLYENAKSFSVVETNPSKVSDCVCCMYPKCHNSYENCKMHSPPERDFAVYQNVIVDNPSNMKHVNYEPKLEEKCKSESVTSIRNSDSHSGKKLNSLSYKNSIMVKEDGFKNSELKIFKPVELAIDSQSYSHSPKTFDLRQQRKDQTFYQEQVSYLSPDSKYSDSSRYYKYCNKERQIYRSASNKMIQNFSNENLPAMSIEHAVLINHSEEDNLTIYTENSVHEETVFEVSDQHSSSASDQHSSSASFQDYENIYLKEKEPSLCLGMANSYEDTMNKSKTENISSAESSKSDGDEDEELCLIEENARNNYSNISRSYQSTTPDLALPSPPLNDKTEIVPSNEPLPSPPNYVSLHMNDRSGVVLQRSISPLKVTTKIKLEMSFSPIKEVIYENVEINRRPAEAIYANLEMLKIKCSVVNSATQTSSYQKSADTSDLETRHQAKRSFSFVETEIFSNVIGPTFQSKIRSDYLQSFLQSQLEKHSSVLKENLQKTEEKYSFERHALSLPLASAYFTTSEPKAKFLTRYISSLKDRDIVSDELSNKKEELISSINKKLGILRLEQIALKEEITQNEELGCSLIKKLEKIALPNEVDKVKTHVEELEKITNLMISLSGRLARAENALLILSSDAPLEERGVLEEKYSKLNKQFDEAKYLKKNIDRRNCQVSILLRKYFGEEDFADYDHFISMKVKLLVDYRELDEKIKLGEEQLDELKNNLNNHTSNKVNDNSYT